MSRQLEASRLADSSEARDLEFVRSLLWRAASPSPQERGFQLNTPRTVIIGVDGATFGLIEPLVQAGHLPALGSLMARGVFGPLQAWPNMNSAVAWSSMVTGYNPGQHGIFHFGEAPPQRGTKWRPITAGDRNRDPFWRLLSSAGQRVGVINVPMSYPADAVNGFMLAGMDAPGVHSPGFAHPRDLLDDLRHRGIDYVLDVPNLGVLSRRDPHRLPLAVQRMVDVRARTILSLMQTRQWDVLMAVFVGTDRMQHFFWPDGRAGVEDPDWAPIRSVYQQIDSFIMETLELAGANTTVLVVSDHGFGPAHAAPDCLNRLFARLGLLCYRQGSNRLTGRLLRSLLQYGRQIIPLRFQDPLARAFPGLWLRAVNEGVYSSIEWSQTRVFAATFGRVFINLQGRQPEGTVSPEEYHLLRERVRDILLNLTDPDTGRRVVQAAHWAEDLFHGPYLKQAPDLLIEWDEELLGRSWCYRAGGRPVIIQAPERIGYAGRVTGSHRSQGVVIACGPQIKPGGTVFRATLYDIAPTILYLQGHPIPKDMDGRVLTDIFTQEYLRRHPVQQVEPTSIEPRAAVPELDANDARKIEERLRGLGYID
jgi:predicted AlkP superfamily phosphohydrolase/phosphomutase